MEDNSNKNFLCIGASNSSKMAKHANLPFFYSPSWDEVHADKLVEKLEQVDWSKMPKKVILFSPTNALIRTRGFKGPTSPGDQRSEIIHHLHTPQLNIRRSNKYQQEVRSLERFMKILRKNKRKVYLFPNLMRNIVPTCVCKNRKIFYAVNQIHLFANFQTHIGKAFPDLKVWKHADFCKDMYPLVTQKLKPTKTLTSRDYVEFYTHFLGDDALHVKNMHLVGWSQRCYLSTFEREKEPTTP